MSEAIENYMTRDVISTKAKDSLRDAWDLMQESDFRHLPVMENGGLVGILSDRDILRVGQPRGSGIDVPEVEVSSAMSPDPISCKASCPVDVVAAIMISHRIDCLPVLGPCDALVGMVTSSDLLEILRGCHWHEPPRLSQDHADFHEMFSMGFKRAGLT